jgi:hypothetical protein
MPIDFLVYGIIIIFLNVSLDCMFLHTLLCKHKGKGHSVAGHESPDVEYRYSSTLSLTLALDGGGWSTPHPGRFIPEKDPVVIM